MSWMLNDQSFEKMGSLMADNHGKLLDLYDELAMFLSQINIFRGRGLSDSHELALFYNCMVETLGSGERVCTFNVQLL